MKTAFIEIWQKIRPSLGWFCIGFGILGLLLPVLQGTICLVIGVALVGPRNRKLRIAVVTIKRAVRYWAALPHPVIGRLGKWALQAEQTLTRNYRRIARRFISSDTSQETRS